MPEPCGCRVERSQGEGEAQTGAAPTPELDSIAYCPTHAAAFRLAEMLRGLVGEGAPFVAPHAGPCILCGSRPDMAEPARALLAKLGR